MRCAEGRLHRACARAAWIAACTLAAGLPAAAYQIAPNPNHGTIVVAAGESAWNEEFFESFGPIEIHGELENRPGATLLTDETSPIANAGLFHNAGYMQGTAAITNAGTGRIENEGTIFLDGTSSSGRLENAGLFVNRFGSGWISGFEIWNRAGATFHNEGQIEAWGHLDNEGSLLVGALGEWGDVAVFDRLTNRPTGLVEVAQGQLGFYQGGSMTNEGQLRVGPLGTLTQWDASRIVQTAGASMEIDGTFFQLAGAELEVAGSLRVDPLAFLYMEGRLRVRPEGVLEIHAPIDLREGATWRIEGLLRGEGSVVSRESLVNTGSVELEGGIFAESGVLENHGSWYTPLDAFAGAGVDAHSPLNAAGATWIVEGQLSSDAGFDNAGLLVNRGYVALLGVSSNDGTLLNDGGPLGMDLHGRLDHRGRIENRVDSDLAVWGEIASADGALILNDGSFFVPAEGAVTGSGTFEQRAGTVVVAGLLEQSAVEMSGGSLGGSGTVRGLLHQAGGTLEPGGNRVGVLHVDGSYVQERDALLQIEFDAAGHDVLEVALQATLLGDVRLDLGGASPIDFGAGDAYDILLASSIDASRARFWLPFLGPDLLWRTSVDPLGDGEVLRLEVLSVPEPRMLALVGGLGVALTLERRRRFFRRALRRAAT